MQVRHSMYPLLLLRPPEHFCFCKRGSLGLMLLPSWRFTATETTRLIRDKEPRTASSNFTTVKDVKMAPVYGDSVLDWSECVTMSVLGTTKHSSCNQCKKEKEKEKRKKRNAKLKDLDSTVTNKHFKLAPLYVYNGQSLKQFFSKCYANRF